MEKWGKAQTALKKVFSALPDGYHKMASGMQLYNVHLQVVRDHYRNAFVSNTCAYTPFQELTNLSLFFSQHFSLSLHPVKLTKNLIL
jgi:hypothetical protein